MNIKEKREVMTLTLLLNQSNQVFGF